MSHLELLKVLTIELLLMHPSEPRRAAAARRHDRRGHYSAGRFAHGAGLPALQQVGREDTIIVVISFKLK